jgi:hypothetical protein
MGENDLWQTIHPFLRQTPLGRWHAQRTTLRAVGASDSPTCLRDPLVTASLAPGQCRFPSEASLAIAVVRWRNAMLGTASGSCPHAAGSEGVVLRVRLRP